MEVKDIQGNILIDALVTEQAVKVDELMKQHSITLSWVSVTNDELPLGSYIEHEGVRYSLLAPYKPEQSNEATYSYKPVFEHPVMRWQYIPFFFYTYSEGEIISKELDWSLTDNPANFMKAVCDAILNETGEDWSYEISADLPASASLSFSNADIFSALNTIASVFKTEWWFDYANKIAYLSKASYGDAVTLEVGQNIGIPSKNQSSDGYYTRFYAFGSTRNIEQRYAGSNVNSIVNKRLTLNPEKYPNGYIDIREGLTESEILVKTLEFDDIYPRSSLAIADVKVRLMWRLDNDNQKVQIGTDGDGNPVYDQYAIWYFKVPGLSFDKEQIIAGKALSVHFNSGALNGREFELTYHDKAKTVDTSDGTSVIIEPGEFEINFIEEGTFIIPAISGLIPSDGDEITLFNITMPEEYKASAYDELEKAALKEIAKQGEDMSNYSFSSNAVEFFMSNPALEVGRNVTYKNGNYTYSTRVIKLETQLDRPFEQKITIGNEQIKGTTQTLKEEVVNANQNIDLISAINESTQQLMQSYQRTQKALLDSMSKWGNMWRLDAENNAVYTPLNLIVEGTIGMGGLGEGGSGEVATPNITIKFYGSEIPYTPDANGIITLPAYPEGGGGSGEGGITQVTAQMIEEALGYVPYSSKNPSGYITSAALNGYATEQWVADKGYITNAALNGYATEQWVKQQGYLTQHQDLSAYAKSEDVANTYATKVALQTLQNEHNALSTKVTNLDNLLNSDVSGVINTWGEVVDFLDEYSGSEDLATILAGMNNDIANRVLYTDFEKLEDSVSGIAGYFTNGSANNALKLGGQLPSYYATVDALNAVKNDVTAVSNRVQKFEDVIGIDANGDVYIKGTRNFYTAGGTIGMAGLGSGGSGGGGTAGLGSVTVRVNGQDYITDASGIVTLPNYPSLAGYATEDYVTSRGYITGITSAMVTSALGYTPYNSSNPSGYITASALNGYATESWVGNNYLPLSGGTIEGVLYINTSIPEVRCCIDNNDMAIVGYRSGYGAWLYNDVCGSYLNILDNGTPTYNGNPLFHSGNANRTTVSWAASNILFPQGTSATWNVHTTGAYKGITILNTVGEESEGAPISYAVGLSVSGYYGFTLAHHGGEALYWLKGSGNADWYALIHSGNIGSQSVDFSNYSGYISEYDLEAYLSTKTASISGWHDWGNGTGDSFATYTHGLRITSPDADYYAYFGFDAFGGEPKVRYVHGGWLGEWNTIALTISNVASATKLQTARTIWGQSFDGTGDITGAASFTNGRVNIPINGDRITFNGSGYSMGILAMNNGNTYIEAPLASDSSSAAQTPIIIGWRNGVYPFYIAPSGNILMGTTTDWGFNFASHALSGDKISGYLGSGGGAFFGNIGEGYGTAIWTQGNGNGYIQQGRSDGSAVNYNLYLQPLGGSVIVNSLTRFEGSLIFMNDYGDGIYIHSTGINFHNSNNAWVASCLSFDYYGNTTLYHNLTVTGSAAFTGNVLIGTTTDNGSGAKLQVNGDIAASSFSSAPNDYYVANDKNIPWYGLSVNDGYSKGVWLSGYTFVQIQTATSYFKVGQGSVDTNASVNIYGNLTVTGDITSEGTMAMAKLASSSDRKLKDNIAEVSAEQSMSIIRQLRPTTWNWKKDGKKSYGLIAQEVEPVVPEMVVNMEHLHLEYNQLHAFEIGAIQHIDSEVDKLKKDLAIANGRIEVLENELKQYRRNA